MTVLRGARVVTPHGVLDDGWVRIADDRIAAVGRGPVDAGVHDLGGGWLLPGFIDLHVHGGGGHDVTRSGEDMAAAVAFHRTHGTTRTLVSLVTAPLAALVEQLGWAAALAGKGGGPDGHVVGSHLEGPFLSEARCGAQNAAYLIDPSPDAVGRLLAAAGDQLRSVTLAPELPGSRELVRTLTQRRIVAAVGHTDATYDQAAAAFTAGATLATHLFNGMRPVHHRDPGPVLAALDAGAACEVINDGIHVHPAVLRLVAGRDPAQLVLVTDAIDAAGMGDGEYLLGGQSVTVRDGRAELRDSGSLAGSTLTMDAALRRAVLAAGLPIETAAAAAAANPARVLGIDDRCGAIAAGLDADLVHLDDELRLRAVMAGGEWAVRP